MVKIYKCKFISCRVVVILIHFLSLNSYGQQLDWLDQKIQTSYDKKDPNYHSYAYYTPLCEVNEENGCTIENAFKVLLSDSRFIAPTKSAQPVKNGGILFLTINLPGINFPGLHPIKTVIDQSNYTVTNYTLQGHVLHPGKVERRIVHKNNQLYIFTEGEGYSDFNRYLTGEKLSCTENLKALRTVILAFEYFNEFFHTQLKDMNENNCVVNYVWGPVHGAFIKKMKRSLPTKEYPKQLPVNENNTGGSTPDELGKLLITALKTNDKNLWMQCFHPNETSYKSLTEAQFSKFRDLLHKDGISNWDLVSFSGVKYDKEAVYTNPQEEFEKKVVRNYKIEFTYQNRQYIGELGPMTIENAKNGNYYIFHPGTQANLMLSTNNLNTNALVGGLTPDALGQLIFKAFKTNDKELFVNCIHPYPFDNDKAKIAKDFNRIIDDFKEKGLTDWKLAKFSRVTFSKSTSFGNDDGGLTKDGEQVRRSFALEFTYKNGEFIGLIHGGTIVTFEKKYFIWHGGFGTQFQRP